MATRDSDPASLVPDTCSREQVVAAGMSRGRRSFPSAMRSPSEIHSDIERSSERRSELWQQLSAGSDQAVAAELKAVSAQLERLWDEYRASRAAIKFGDRSRIVARARAEERLERAA
jgi:hypothetical protein